MLTTILNQNETIINYISELNLPYSSAIKNHMVNIVSGIIVTEGSKTISSVHNKITCNRDRSTGSRFLSSYSWNHEYVTQERIFHAISEISNTCEDSDVGFLIIDDTLTKKNTSTKKIEGLDFHNSHADGNKPKWSHCLVTSHYKINDYSIPLDFRQYHRKESSKKLSKKFLDKNELAMELINEFTPVTKNNYLLVDSWYTSAKILLHGLINGCHTIGRIKSNRVIYPAGIKTNVKKFSSYIRTNETSLVTASNNKYYVYRYEGKLNDIENVVVLISWTKNDLSDNPAFIISTDVSLDNKTIISYYEKRWDIEVSYRYHKTALGFDEFQIQSLKSIHRYWSMIFLTYTFLEIFRVKCEKLYKFKNIGDVILHFRNNYLVKIVSFAHECADNGIDLQSTIAKLGLVA
ncbi:MULTISPECIES: IS701 family transposase [Clostridia]|uniref:IS701 family transposase n=24 Tax=Clostridium TaxID=1485 RepID=A0A2A7MHR0_9CLOT|nr:IS701 family transposase [Clostridium neonatale]MBS4851263.1 IS701 family transposase [Bacteroides salyersiae]PEG29430.1 IS701 family transposase [Clostridium neonatale]PEG29955.1 IS701 family transposase [Clostridium neonatale]PEG30093.1 IS701 family transposase [Clostridium neonatale]PEG31362.1 IS701 family transposase [Clostridium neonatale]